MNSQKTLADVFHLFCPNFPLPGNSRAPIPAPSSYEADLAIVKEEFEEFLPKGFKESRNLHLELQSDEALRLFREHGYLCTDLFSDGVFVFLSGKTLLKLRPYDWNEVWIERTAFAPRWLKPWKVPLSNHEYLELVQICRERYGEPLHMNELLESSPTPKTRIEMLMRYCSSLLPEGDFKEVDDSSWRPGLKNFCRKAGLKYFYSEDEGQDFLKEKSHTLLAALKRLGIFHREFNIGEISHIIFLWDGFIFSSYNFLERDPDTEVSYGLPISPSAGLEELFFPDLFGKLSYHEVIDFNEELEASYGKPLGENLSFLLSESSPKTTMADLFRMFSKDLRDSDLMDSVNAGKSLSRLLSSWSIEDTDFEGEGGSLTVEDRTVDVPIGRLLEKFQSEGYLADAVHDTPSEYFVFLLGNRIFEVLENGPDSCGIFIIHPETSYKILGYLDYPVPWSHHDLIEKMREYSRVYGPPKSLEESFPFSKSGRKSALDLFKVFCPNVLPSGYYERPLDCFPRLLSGLEELGYATYDRFTTMTLVDSEPSEFEKRMRGLGALVIPGSKFPVGSLNFLLKGCIYSARSLSTPLDFPAKSGPVCVSIGALESGNLASDFTFSNSVTADLSDHEFMESFLEAKKFYGSPKVSESLIESSSTTYFDLFKAFAPGLRSDGEYKPPGNPISAESEFSLWLEKFHLYDESMRGEEDDDENWITYCSVEDVHKRLSESKYLLSAVINSSFYILFRERIFMFWDPVGDEDAPTASMGPTGSGGILSANPGTPLSVSLSAHEFMEATHRFRKVYGDPKVGESLTEASSNQKTLYNVFEAFTPDLNSNAGESGLRDLLNFMEEMGAVRTDFESFEFWGDAPAIFEKLDGENYLMVHSAIGTTWLLYEGHIFDISSTTSGSYRILPKRRDDNLFDYCAKKFEFSAHEYLEVLRDYSSRYGNPLREASGSGKTLYDVFTHFVPPLLDGTYRKSIKGSPSVDDVGERLADLMGGTYSSSQAFDFNSADLRSKLIEKGFLCTETYMGAFFFLFGDRKAIYVIRYMAGGIGCYIQSFDPEAIGWLQNAAKQTKFSEHEFMEKVIDLRDKYGDVANESLVESSGSKTWLDVFKTFTNRITDDNEYDNSPKSLRYQRNFFRYLVGLGLKEDPDCYALDDSFDRVLETMKKDGLLVDLSVKGENFVYVLYKDRIFSVHEMGPTPYNGISKRGIWVEESSGGFEFGANEGEFNHLGGPLSQHEFLETVMDFRSRYKMVREDVSPLDEAFQVSAAVSTVMLDMPHEVEDLAEDVAQSIRKADLAPNGYEDYYHCTLKYGLTSSDPAPVRFLLQNYEGFKFAVGGIRAFEAAETGSQYDVLYFEIRDFTNHLSRVNAELTGLGAIQGKHSVYRPHITIARLRPGSAKAYVNPFPDSFLTQYFSDKVSFSDPSRRITKIEVGKKSLGSSFSPDEIPLFQGKRSNIYTTNLEYANLFSKNVRVFRAKRGVILDLRNPVHRAMFAGKFGEEKVKFFLRGSVDGLPSAKNPDVESVFEGYAKGLGFPAYMVSEGSGYPPSVVYAVGSPFSVRESAEASSPELPLSESFPSGKGYSTLEIRPDSSLKKKIYDLYDTIDQSDSPRPAYKGDFHITLCSQLSSDSPLVPSILLSGIRSLEIEFGSLFSLPSSLTGKPYDILAIEILDPTGSTSKAVEKLRLASFSKYENALHMTLAFLNPGSASKYVGMKTPNLGGVHRFNGLLFMDSGRRETYLSLGKIGRRSFCPPNSTLLYQSWDDSGSPFYDTDLKVALQKHSSRNVNCFFASKDETFLFSNQVHRGELLKLAGEGKTKRYTKGTDGGCVMPDSPVLGDEEFIGYISKLGFTSIYTKESQSSPPSVVFFSGRPTPIYL